MSPIRQHCHECVKNQEIIYLCFPKMAPTLSYLCGLATMLFFAGSSVLFIIIALHPHLTLQDVADRSGYNRSYISGIIKAEWGGFFTYVNRLRLAHVDSWLQEHPAGTIQEAVEASGFSSRQTYYAVKSRMAE